MCDTFRERDGLPVARSSVIVPALPSRRAVRGGRMACSSRWSGAVVIAAVGFLSTAGAQVDLVNRSFENGADPGEMMVVQPGSTTIEGWTVVGKSVWYV